MASLWLERTVVDVLHEDQRQRHGGNTGVASDDVIDAAIAGAQDRFRYTGESLFDCAAAYLVGLARNGGYSDVNKRTAFVVALTFLRTKGIRIDATPEDVILLMLDAAAGVCDERRVAEWLRARASKLHGRRIPRERGHVKGRGDARVERPTSILEVP